ncbi:MAG: hypothetical protein RIQ62_1179, partial [Bacteroidota bacterium]
NGVLDATEINASLTQYVCNGATGIQGPTGATGPQGPIGLTGATGATGPQGPIGLTGATGATGPQGPAGANGTNGINGVNGKNTLAKTTIESSGINCPVGGLKLEYGLDINNNGVLDATEINASLTKYVCNGATGATGVTGPQGPIGLTGAVGPQGPTGANGTNGTNGIDGKNTLAKTTIESAGVNCSTGGVKLEYGMDSNNNGVLDATEINPSLTTYICNGTAGPQGPIGLTGAIGSQGTAGINGIDGKNTLANSTPEPAGINCATGGVKLEYGLDANNNGLLDAGEINNALTQYICNGAMSLLPNGTLDGNTPFWNGSAWVVNNSNIYNNGGNIGLGTLPSSNFKVSVGGNVDVQGRYIQVGKDTAGECGITKNIPLNTPGFDGSFIMGMVANYGTVEVHHVLGGYAGGAGQSNFYTTFNTCEGGVGAGERMRINPNGNVGIGTKTPEYLLTIRDTSNLTPYSNTALLATAIQDNNFKLVTSKGSASNGAFDVMTQIGQSYGGGLITEGIRFLRGGGTTAGSISLTTASTERMRITAEGNVGIGLNSSNSASLLCIKGNSYNQNTLWSEGYVTDNPGDPAIVTIRGVADGPAVLEISKAPYTARNFGLIRIGVDGNLTNLYGSNGGLGIGIQPQRSLHVNDVMRLEPRYTIPGSPSKGDIYFDGNTNKLRVFDGTTWQDCW